MGLLSKIFNTDKLAYILREEEEFSVAAPKQWNVETLTVGDTITPDMFKDQYRFYDFDLYIKEIGWDDEYEHDDIEGSWYVTTKFDDSEGEKKYGHNQFVWWLHELNDFLKPQYQVFQPLFESKEDEFNVDAPQNWNIEYLSIGDQITPDMWNQKSKLIWDLLDTDINKTYKIIDFFEEWDGYEEQEDFDPIFVELEDEVGHISTESLTVLQGALKPEFKITQNKNLNESEDDFNIEAPAKWNVEHLSEGDTITPDMWISPRNSIYNGDKNIGILEVGYDGEGPFVVLQYPDGHPFDYDLAEVNENLKPQYQIFKSLSESEEDEFNVDAPEDWNVIELGVGDQITPDMWQSKQYDLNIQGKTAEITDIGVDDKGPYVVLAHNNPYWSLDYDIDIINDLLKPQYKIEQNLIESDEDFNVDAPAEWDITELKKGDYIMPDMWVKDIDDFFTGQSESKYLFKQLTSKPIKITGVMRGDELYFEVAGLHFILTNDFLLPQYKVVGDFGMYESNKDEFNVEAPIEWNEITLGVGDTITPDMWNRNDMQYLNGLLYLKYDSPMKIQRIKDGRIKFKGHNPVYLVKSVNDRLKNWYQVDSSLTESEDEFNVDAPSEWDVTELSKGDIITPDMWKDDLINWNHDVRIDGFKPYNNEVGYMVYIKHLDSNRTPSQVFDLGEINDWLKNAYRVEVNGLMESDEDDFSVDAPAEWGITYLGVGDTIKGKMWDWKKIINMINRDHGDDHEAINKDIEMWKRVYDEGITINSIKNFQDEPWIDVGNDLLGWGPSVRWINRLLSDDYKIELSLNESEDDFSVDAPSKWNVTDLEIGDYIYPDMINVPRDKRKWNHYHNMLADPKRTDGWQITEFKKHGVRDLVKLEYNGVGNFFDVDVINSILKQYRIFPPTNETKLSSLLEIDDEFTVKAPPEWDNYLTIGDTVTPDMWDDEARSLKNFKDFNTVLNNSLIIKNLYPQKIGGDPGYLIVFNDHTSIHSSFLDPKYIIDPPLNESDDEFNVDAPENWNITELGIGDILDSSNLKMQDPMKKFEIVDFKVSLFPWETNKAVLKVFQLKDEPIPGTNRTTKQWKYIRNIFVELKILNDRLKDNFKIIPSLRENEEEDFSVEASPEWNVTELTIGDYITPDMWDEDSDIFDLIDDPNEDWLINVGWVSDDVELTTKTGGQVITDINNINTYLKPQYRIVKNKDLFEEKEDFSVDAPQEWNIEYLTTGDTITPDMWDQSKLGLSKYYFDKPITIDWIGYNEFDDEEEELLVSLDLGKVSTEYDIDFVNHLLKPEYKVVQNKNLTEEEDFSVDAPAKWYQHELKVGDYFNEVEGKVYTHEEDLPERTKAYTYEVIYLGPNEGEYYKSAFYNHNIIAFRSNYNKDSVYTFTVDYFNDTRGPKLNAYIDLPDRFSLNEDEEDFNVDASPEWDVIELKVGDYINSNMLNPKGNDYIWFSRRKLFIEDIYFDECWTVNLLHVESGYHTPFCIDYINEDVLNNKYRIMTSLNELLEIDDEFDVEAPQKWDVIELGVGDKITKDMIKSPGFIHQIGENFQMDFPGVITKIYKSGPIDDDQYWGIRIKFKNKGWKKYLPQSEDVKLGLGLSLDDFNEDVLKPQYQIQKPVFELSTLLENEEDFNVNAPDEWNVELLTVGDTVTPEMWGYEQINSWFDISKPLTIEDIGEDDGGWWVQLGRNEAPFDLDEVNEFLKPQYKIVPYNLEESDDEFNIDAPEEWNYDYWEPTSDINYDDEVTESFITFVSKVLKNKGVEEKVIESYLDEIFNFGDLENYVGISSGELIKDFFLWTEAENEDDEWYNGINEEEEDFSVNAPEDWWEYDGDVEIMFQDTYWYEDENGKEAIVERDGGGIVNINDLEQYSYSDWKPFTGNPTNENLTKWYYSINWDTDLVEMFDFDDSLFEVEEDFDWSTAENVDMDRTGFKIRAVSTLKEVDDEFTVKAPKKWDIIYLNKGDFLDNTNSTFNDPNVKYEIGNITSDGEIEVKKYINRGNGFEPQFDRFMKTRKGIVKAKLKPGFDIEIFSK